MVIFSQSYISQYLISMKILFFMYSGLDINSLDLLELILLIKLLRHEKSV